MAINQTLDQSAAEIWKTYALLEEITEKQNDMTKASEYRRQSQKAYQKFQGGRKQHQLQKYEPLIARIVAAIFRGESPVVEAESGQEKPVAAIQHILNGERDEKVLCEPLNYIEAAVVHAILHRIELLERFKDYFLSRTGFSGLKDFQNDFQNDIG